MRAVSGLGLSLLVALAACQPKAETPEQAQARMERESQAAKTVIDSLDREFASHFNQGHGDVVAGMYVEQAHLMPPNGPAAVGRDAIKTALSPFFAMQPELKLTADAVVVNGPLAIERGSYTLRFTPPGAPGPVTDTGKYLVSWHLVDGKWMVADDIWNSDLPAMPMGPPAKP